jgi:hypothetical protein
VVLLVSLGVFLHVCDGTRCGYVPNERRPDKSKSGEVAEIVGLTLEQLRYAIELGRVTDCKGRDGQGTVAGRRRRWRGRWWSSARG